MDRLWTDEDESADRARYWVAKVQSMRRFTLRSKHENEDEVEDTRAPYKPLLLLWLIGRLDGGQPLRVPFGEAERELRQVMHRYRLDTRNDRVTTARVVNPFVYLGSSPELWLVKDSAGNDVTAMPQKTKESPVFLRREAVGVVAPEFELALRDQHVRSAVVNELLRMEFPETLHEEILEDVNLGHLVASKQSPRDPHFKSLVLRAYENRCSFCGYDGRLGGSPVGIDAAHVKMHSKGGSDLIENGLALCVQHHRLFDYGALGLDENHRILVSEHLNLSDQNAAAHIGSLVGARIRRPLRRYRLPAEENVDWHSKNLFKHPAR